MIRNILKVIKYTLTTLLAILIVLMLSIAYLYFSADRSIPEVKIPVPLHEVSIQKGYTQYDSSILRLNRPGLWELHLKGDASERGLAFGQLCKNLMYLQEKAFVDQIRNLVPSENYLNFLKYFTIIYNRNIGGNIPEEYRKEIYTSSLGCSHEFDFIGSAYERQLNYHAAHDLGHAMQEYMLVGCSSFGVWGALTEGSTLMIGRNFDFYVGEQFAKNKIVSFYYPDKGYKFASVGWAGMVGVLSGMNEKGLTVTINAAKSSPPISSKTPISIIAREILQYSSDIDEAFNIAQRMEAFVSESILIGSAKDGIAAIIEKTPDRTTLYKVEGDMIISTNHFQSPEFMNDSKNYDYISKLPQGHSMYRYNRIQELINEEAPLNPDKIAEILRNPLGMGNKPIGWTNEKSLNQFISHHAVIFEPCRRIMWVSTDPWQIGEMVAYNLDSVFKKKTYTDNSNIKSLSIPGDSLLLKEVYGNVVKLKKMTIVINDAIKNKKSLPDSLLNLLVGFNPDYYHTYELLGDYYQSAGYKDKSLLMYQESLKRELSSLEAKLTIETKINKLKVK